jgi:hypothetical protein
VRISVAKKLLKKLMKYSNTHIKNFTSSSSIKGILKKLFVCFRSLPNKYKMEIKKTFKIFFKWCRDRFRSQKERAILTDKSLSYLILISLYMSCENDLRKPKVHLSEIFVNKKVYSI